MKRVKDYIPSEQERKAYQWCINNNVYVHVKPRGINYTLVMVVDGVGRSSGKLYSKEDIFFNQWKYYLYLYENLNDVRG